MQNRHDVLERREWRVMERYVSPMPSDGIFRGVVPSRYVAIAQTGLKISLNFMASGVPADAAAARHFFVSLGQPAQASFSPCDGALRSSPTAAVAAWAVRRENL
jgi:hypothetical protein